MGGISIEDRNEARSLARRVVTAVIDATKSGSVIAREDYLDSLLDAGMQLL